MTPRNDVSEERKSQILKAARETFTEQGFHNTRMSDIAEASGLSKGALYWYFESKDAIILSLLEKVFEPELKDLKSLLEDNRSTEERLYIYAERAAEDILQLLRWMPLVYEFMVLAFRRRKIKTVISNYYNSNLQLLENLIQQGIDAGELEGCDAEEAAIALGSIIEGTVMLWIYDPDGIDIKDHMLSSTRILVRGLQAADQG